MSCAIQIDVVDPKTAAEVVGGEWILRRMIHAQWIKPVIRENRLTRYYVPDLHAAAARLKLEPLPPLPRG